MASRLGVIVDKDWQIPFELGAKYEALRLKRGDAFIGAYADWTGAEYLISGRPRHETRDPALPGLLESLVEPLARGDPQSPLRWTCKSTRALARELTRKKHPTSHEKVAQFLRGMNYSLQGNRKTEEGAGHPDRDAQFEYLPQPPSDDFPEA